MLTAAAACAAAGLLVCLAAAHAALTGALRVRGFADDVRAPAAAAAALVAAAGYAFLAAGCGAWLLRHFLEGVGR